MKHPEQKGFTLIELLVVIAIIAVLAVVVVLTLNPAELLKQARDSNRISDLNTMKSALSLFVADGNTSLATGYASCYVSTSTSPGANCDSAFSTNYATATTTGSKVINGSGWIPVNFNAISSGAPISNLPVDPINNATYWYGYGATSSDTTFKLTARMESSKYADGGSGDVESTDGGISSSTYEVGTKISL